MVRRQRIARRIAKWQAYVVRSARWKSARQRAASMVVLSGRRPERVLEAASGLMVA